MVPHNPELLEGKFAQIKTNIAMSILTQNDCTWWQHLPKIIAQLRKIGKNFTDLGRIYNKIKDCFYDRL